MSYPDPEFESPERRSARRGPLPVALAALVPGALLGWMMYEAVGGGGSGVSPRAGVPASAFSRTSAAASSPVRSASAPSFASPGDDAKGAAGAGSGPLAGKVIVIDPGHNQGNFQHPAEINRQVDIGTNWKECDAIGTSTKAGYTEADFTLDVAHRLGTLLERQGATVKLTRDGDAPPWGPCVTERAQIGNEAHADAAISIHADDSAEGDRGFHVILPGTVHAGAADTRPIVGPSRDLGARVAGFFLRETREPPSNYVGEGTGLVTRTDLGGLNLSTVPKVFIECGNMRDSKDSALLAHGAWRQKAAQGLFEGIADFLNR
ncbi:N-acetylmuramoyl-L-alanine amidase [Streptomyces sp. SP2-10]|uniref:N-acetylmuramoyl-L-alanine amidase n=1 Tax=Streptomyces sp. SP2-10 TaxID=2873385 RepID=UPI001CA640E1|nr:N-acetylmuramoyl-L-alanine amidase [Streptomyces sp. SP2-10]MBY8846999.1 N-acetylmuramoyl-L-alanine amidase [Streptomyces sp. SP2-10]